MSKKKKKITIHPIYFLNSRYKVLTGPSDLTTHFSLVKYCMQDLSNHFSPSIILYTSQNGRKKIERFFFIATLYPE